MRIHLHLPRLASCLFWPIAKSGLKKAVWRLCFFLREVREPARCVYSGVSHAAHVPPLVQSQNLGQAYCIFEAWFAIIALVCTRGEIGIHARFRSL